MTILAIVLMTLGVGFLLIAAIGLIRLPDPLQRMHSATKAGTLGTSLILLGILGAGDVARPSTALLTIVFLLITLPIGAQLLGRAAYLSGAPAGETDSDAPLRKELPGATAESEERSGEAGARPRPPGRTTPDTR